MQKVELRFLTPHEMENAKDMDYRYKDVDSDNLGFSDPVKNRIFVRAGLEKELTSYLISHELEHLGEEEGTHEDSYGIRHKKGPKFFKDIVGPFSYNPGNIFGQAHGPIADISSALLPIAAGAINPALGVGVGAAQGILGKKASYQGDSFSNMFGGQIPQANQSSFGQGFGQTGSFAPSGSGPNGGQGAPMANIGLGAGLPNQANISMGQQGGPEQQQRQSGFWFPSYRF